ncbi:putative histidine kinase/HSP90-like ATPase superfamily protein [Tanacetum coccineum]
MYGSSLLLTKRCYLDKDVLLALESCSWDALGVQMQHVPVTEGKINAFINCFIRVWKVTTLADLEAAVCKKEGVQQFEELELGPLIRHPLINYYFCVSRDSTRAFEISSQEKKQLDDNFSVISQRIKSFSTEHGNKHIRFKSSSEDEDDDEDNDDDIETDDNEDEACKKSSNKKRKADAIDSTSNASRKIPKGGSDKQDYVVVNLSKKVRCKRKHPADMSLDNDSMMTFITLWKDRCKGKDVFKIALLFFISFSAIYTPNRFFFPMVGHEAADQIRSINRGMWDSMFDTLQDSMYDTLQALEQGEAVKDSMDHTDNVTIETEQNDTQLVNKHASKQHCVLKKVSEYLKDNHDVSSDSNSVCGRNTFFHRNLFKCEVWITQQFAVDNFESFGYGDFLTLLERKVSALPSFVQEYLGSNGTHDKPSLKASMSRQLLDLGASHSLSEKESLSIQNVLELLTMQFPLIPFSIDKDGSQKALEDIVKSNKSIPVSKNVLFSSALLSPHNVNSSSETHISSKDAIEVLLRPPISGNVIRIDHTATVDSFLEASIRGCPFRTALNLLSLFVVYGGEKNVPSSLLKCHAEKAFKVIVNNKDQSEDKREHNMGIVNASKFVLECLAYLPTEFRFFATNLLLSGFRSIVKDAPSAILSQCRHAEDHKSSGFDQEKDMSTSYPPDRKDIISTKVDVHRVEGKVGSVIGRNMGVKQRSSTSNNEEVSAKKIIESIRREEFGLDPKLYSLDSHFLLELVQNADDNVYPCDVEPTLTFILQEASVIVLNNERGFSAENIKALCDVGNSTKKEPSAGYIGKKGIGFKSVFRVIDAPEIHSNGFHIKFDISDGQIGFVFPTVVQPCNIDMFNQLVSVDSDTTNEKRWNTRIVLPFRSKKKEGFSVENLISLFSDLHPALLLFLHRLECIKFRNLLNDSLVVMRKEVVGDGIVNVTVGEDKMTWFVKSHKLQSDHICHDVQTTEISMALTDFILPSSREEVDGPWNQWLSEFPNLFVSAELSFCSLPCFNKNPAKEGDSNEWVPPCKVLRNWTEQTRSILPDNLMKEHLGIEYMNKDTVLTDSLARALGIEECGPKVLIQIMQSLCRAGSLNSMGLSWLSSWLNVLFSMSVGECAIWLHTDPDHGLEAFGNLYSKLRIVNPVLFNDSHTENITHMLYKVGVQQLSAHEVLKMHILPAICDEKCLVEKEHILSQLRNNAFISTNHGYKRLVDVPIHFSKKFGNPVDMSKLVGGTDMKWFEIDTSYLKHPAYKSSPRGKLKWRKFLQELGVTDFVQIVEVEKLISDIPHTVIKNMMLDDDCISSGSIVQDYASEELMHLLSIISSHGDREKGKYLMEVLDNLWDDYFSEKITGLCSVNGQNKPFKSSILRILRSIRWMASSIDDQLHFPNDLFYNCEMVCSVLGDNAPYAVPKGTSVKLITDIGLKNTVNVDDALSALEVWRTSAKPFMARS